MVNSSRPDLDDVTPLHHHWRVFLSALRHRVAGEETDQTWRLTLQMMTVSPSSTNCLYCRKLLIIVPPFLNTCLKLGAWHQSLAKRMRLIAQQAHARISEL